MAVKYGHPFLFTASLFAALAYYFFGNTFFKVPFSSYHIVDWIVLLNAFGAFIFSSSLINRTSRKLYLEQIENNKPEKRYYIFSILVAGFIFSLPMVLLFSILTDRVELLLPFSLFFAVQFFVVSTICRLCNMIEKCHILSFVVLVILITSHDQFAYLVTIVLNPFQDPSLFSNPQFFDGNQLIAANVLIASRVLMLGLGFALWSLISKPEKIQGFSKFLKIPKL